MLFIATKIQNERCESLGEFTRPRMTLQDIRVLQKVLYAINTVSFKIILLIIQFVVSLNQLSRDNGNSNYEPSCLRISAFGQHNDTVL